MAKPGPAPTPTALRKLRGNPSKRPFPKDEAQPRAGIPYCPRHIQGEARNEWKRISKELADCGLLTLVDRAALAAYCQAWGRWVQAEDVLRDGTEEGLPSGLVVKTWNGTLVQSPMLAVANRAMDQMKAFLCEFGMTPASRTRVQVQKPQAEKDPLDKLRDFGIPMRKN